jgi:hypothetical protein
MSITLHLITDLETGGAEMMLFKLVLSIDESEFQNVVVSMMDEGTLGQEPQKSDVPVYCLGMKRGVIWVKARELIEQQFNLPVFVSRYEDLFREIFNVRIQ